MQYLTDNMWLVYWLAETDQLHLTCADVENSPPKLGKCLGLER